MSTGPSETRAERLCLRTSNSHPNGSPPDLFGAASIHSGVLNPIGAFAALMIVALVSACAGNQSGNATASAIVTASAEPTVTDSTKSQQTGVTDSTSAPVAESTVEVPLATGFDQNLMNDLGYLQITLEAELDGAVGECIRSLGFEYTPVSPKTLLARANARDQTSPEINPAQRALERLDGTSSGEPNTANESYAASLGEPQQEAYFDAIDSCEAEHQDQFAHPALREGSWFLIADEQVAQRMASRTDVVEAYSDEASCIQSSSGSSLQSATQAHSQDVDTVLDQLQAGAISKDDARRQLQELSITEAQLATQTLPCIEARAAVENKAYVDEMEKYRRENEGAFLGWIQEMQPYVERYSSQIGALREEDK